MSEDSRSSRALEVFASFVVRKEDGAPERFEELLAAHPEIRDELEQYRADWRRVGPVLDNLGLESAALGEQETDASAEAPSPSGKRADSTSEAPATERWGDEGRYRVVRTLGRGGMGVVSEVFDRDLNRRLAMKVLHTDGDPLSTPGTRELARFVEEAQITAQLDHPGIPPVHELGLDAKGRPFLIMKRVQGKTLGALCASPDTDRTSLLNLLIRVCDAVSYAHSLGVVHRDLKPSNVMVGEFGEVYVMDWGLARVLDPDSGVRSPRSAYADGCVADDDGEDTWPYTKSGDILGTPGYMAPEQREGDSDLVGPRADVYSLGVILEQVLTRERPHVSKSSTDDPRRKLGAEVPAELVAIRDRATARPPEERYPGATELGNDLRAYLEGRVVGAHATGPWMELKKWVRRNPGISALGSLAALVALLFVVYVEKTRPALLAMEASDRAQRVERQLQDGFMYLTDESFARAKESFEGAMATSDSAVAEALIGLTIGWVSQGDWDEIRSVLGAHSDLARGHPVLGPILVASEQPGPRSVLFDHSRLERELDYYSAGRWLLAEAASGNHDLADESIEYLERAVLMAQQARPLYHLDLAHAYSHIQGDAGRTLQVLEAAHDLWPGEYWVELASARHLLHLGDPDGALPHSTRAVETRPEELEARLLHALVRTEIGEFDAIEDLRECHKERPTSYTHHALGRALRLAGDLEESLVHAELAVEYENATSGAHHNYGLTLEGLKRFEEAARAQSKAIELDPDATEPHFSLGYALHQSGDRGGARRAYEKALELDPSHARSQVNLGNLDYDSGELDPAESHYDAALANDAERFEAHHGLGNVHYRRGQFVEAVENYLRCVEIQPDFDRAHFQLGLIYRRLHEYDASLSALLKVLDLRGGSADLHYAIGNTLRDMDRFDEAISSFEEALRITPSYAEAFCNLGNTYKHAGRFAESVEAYVECDRVGRSRPGWSYPSEQWLADAEQMLEIGNELDTIVTARAEYPTEILEEGRHGSVLQGAIHALARDGRLPVRGTRPRRRPAADLPRRECGDPCIRVVAAVDSNADA